ncbi:MAG TPA: hypothetical protein VJS37_02190 [Terriglobales bacterium]|jgi:hypothetical protein|nr:hypothetical protein [Terriglobales bacterium]
MPWTILKIIVTVTFGTLFFTYAMVWYVRSSLSEDLAVRRRLRIVDGVVCLVIAGFSILHPANKSELTVALIVSGLVVALWLWRGVRFFRRRTEDAGIRTG